MRRKAFYPAHWAWEGRPFTLVQVDVKDVLDKGTLGTKLWDHLKRKLPRYEWRCLEERTRLWFLALSHEITKTFGLCFISPLECVAFAAGDRRGRDLAEGLW